MKGMNTPRDVLDRILLGRKKNSIKSLYTVLEMAGNYTVDYFQ